MRPDHTSCEPPPPTPLPTPAVRYENETKVEDELKIAEEVQAAVTERVVDFMDDVRSGKTPNLSAVKSTVRQMEQSILRNPDAFMWLRQLKKKDAYSYTHCIDCSALAVAFGRQLGLPGDQIHDLAIGALLFDVGKSKVPQNILAKAGKLIAPVLQGPQPVIVTDRNVAPKPSSVSARTRMLIAWR